VNDVGISRAPKYLAALLGQRSFKRKAWIAMQQHKCMMFQYKDSHVFLNGVGIRLWLYHVGSNESFALIVISI
jgi:hypothetical protein